MPVDEKNIAKRKQYQYWLNKGLGSCALANTNMAEIVQEALKFHDGNKYDLLAWSIMPNHVHVLIKTHEHLSRIIQSWKSFTGKWAFANKKKYQLGIETDAKHFWMLEFWDRFIRDEAHFNNTVRYILNNPAKAKLPKGHNAYRFRGLTLDRQGNQRLNADQVKMIMTREKDDPKELFELLGSKEYQIALQRQIIDSKSNLRLAIVID